MDVNEKVEVPTPKIKTKIPTYWENKDSAELPAKKKTIPSS